MTKYLPINKVIPLMLAYCVVTVLGMYHHELWFDEVQHWLLARDSNSFPDLLSSGKYDDHVPLWKFILFFLTHYVSADPFSLQVLHLVVINVAVLIFLRYAPYNLIAKVLIVFGYYFVFEYSILCRNYALGILFLFTACTLISKPDKNLLKIGLLLILMCCTQELVAFAAVSIFLYLLCYNYEHKSLNRRFLAFTLLFLAAITIPLLHLLTMPSDSINFQTIKPSWLSVHNISFAIHGIDKGFIPFPPLHDPNFWNRHLFESWSSFVKVPVSLFFLTCPVWVLRKSKKSFIFYISATFLLILFLTMSQMTASRYYGMFFIYFITAVWLSDLDGANIVYVSKKQNLQKTNTITVGIFYLILVTQVFAGIYIYGEDYARPFSQGKKTVKFIQDRHLDNLPIVVDVFNAGATLSAYLGRPVYHLDIDTTGSYFSAKVLSSVNRKSLAQEIREAKHLPTSKQFILVSNRSDCDSELTNIQVFHFSKLNSFQGAIISAENYHVYMVTRN